jgi:hypothetical protein
VRVRSTCGGVLTGFAEREDWEFGATGTWVASHKRALHAAIAILGAFVLVLMQRPGPKGVLVVAVLVVVGIAVVEVLGRAIPPRGGGGNAAQPQLFDSG